MATWPTTLPQPLLAGYAVSPSDPSLRTEMETGAARSRRRSYGRNDRINASWSMTDAQFSAFRTWFEDDAEAAGGSAWFAITLRIGDTGATSEEARFVGIYQAQMLHRDRWQVSATLEVR